MLFDTFSQAWLRSFNMAATGRRTKKRKPQDSGVYFAAGFRLPTMKQSRNAIGLSTIPNIFEPGPENAYFQRILHPNSVDDWLAQYNEEGQTFKSFSRTCPWISGRKVKYTKQTFTPEGKNIKERYPDGKIYILPIGDFDQSVSDWQPSIADLTDYTERFYSLPVVVLPSVKLELPSKKGTGNVDRRMQTYVPVNSKTAHPPPPPPGQTLVKFPAMLPVQTVNCPTC